MCTQDRNANDWLLDWDAKAKLQEISKYQNNVLRNIRHHMRQT